MLLPALIADGPFGNRRPALAGDGLSRDESLCKSGTISYSGLQQRARNNDLLVLDLRCDVCANPLRDSRCWAGTERLKDKLIHITSIGANSPVVLETSAIEAPEAF